ncbi:hypothetical protein CNMCM6805_005333 [Aspergillus fumigatiaffinis]|uniref:Pre-mRNA polyadenylation factor Fip1 domain-containing protein n=1 Tax=Aspergillus fumigatiaffinis TaxID=340414 RepID=A0A8H4MD96_9EURO|nr:hypothetical protein CNMCM5878_006121 [Aspergillus fumigatiaffinis]KAF4215813.1 hypothetical protein CNMCM6457_005663 [Aspergillus fumigatiaffinis]KAF4239876.1 hypothetical protein CNMCM6805_005333 [Aspergillus fumigatiaffinis]
MEDDDDLYDPADAVPTTQQHPAQNPHSNAPAQGTDLGEEEEIEVEEDDDGFNIITEAPPEAPPPEVQGPASHPKRRQSNTTQSSFAPCGPPSRIPAPVIRRFPNFQIRDPIRHPQSRSRNASASQRTVSRTPETGLLILPPASARVHHRRQRKPVPPGDRETVHVDRPRRRLPRRRQAVRRPGSDISDYFNYSFDEFTWASHRIKQQELRKELGDQKKLLEVIQNFPTMGFPMPDGPPPPMPGMNPEMMQNMLARMMAQGLDPSSMVPMSFMDHAQAMRPNQSGAGDGQQGQFGGQGGGIEVSMAVDKDGGDGGSRACGLRSGPELVEILLAYVAHIRPLVLGHFRTTRRRRIQHLSDSTVYHDRHTEAENNKSDD